MTKEKIEKSSDLEIAYKIIENNFLFFTRLVITFPSPIKCSCPITSSNFFGLILTANNSFIVIPLDNYIMKSLRM